MNLLTIRRIGDNAHVCINLSNLMKLRFFLTAFILGCFVTGAHAQITLSGKVINAKTGKPVQDVNIRLLQTNIGTATDAGGEFILKNVPQGQYTMRASAVNFTSQEQSVSSSREGMVIRLEEAPLDLNQIVVTGTGTHHRMKDTPVPVEVISGKELKNAGITNFRDAVTMLAPSFSFSSTPMANYTTMSGLGNNHLLILVDGQKMAGNVSGATDISRINMNNVKRIEILKGAASSLYGSDALGGVINIITDQTKNNINISSLTRYAQHNQFEEAVNADFNTKKFGSFTSYNRRQADGWQLNPEAVTIKNGTPGEPKPTVRQASEQFFSNIFNQKFIYNPTKTLSFYANGSYYNKATQRPSSETDDTGYDYDVLNKSYNFGFGAKYLLGNKNYLSLDLYNDNFETDNQYIADTKSNKKGDKELNQKQHYYSANLRGVFKIGQYNKLSAGTEFVDENLLNPDASLTTKKSVYTLAAYAQDELKILKKLQAVVGVRYVYNEKFGSRATPKASLMYTWGPVNFRASYASGFRTPTLKELYYIKEKGSTMSLGNPDLEPEKSNYYSLNVEYVNPYFTMGVTGYINRVKDLIDLQTLKDPETVIPDYDDKYTYKMYWNVANAEVKGMDVNLRSYLGAGFLIGGGYSYTHATDTDTKQPLLRSIKHSGNVNANWNHTWGRYDLNVNLAGHIQSNRYEDSQEAAPGHSLWNFTVRNTFNNLGRFIIEPTVGIENLFNYKDDRYYGYYYGTTSPGRVFFISVLIKFSK